METTAVKILSQIAPEDAEHIFYHPRSLYRRIVVAESLGIPAHELGSSLKRQTLYHLHQTRARSQRAAIYRSELRASTTLTRTASATHDIPQLLALAASSQSQRANSRPAINATSGGDSICSESCNSRRNELAVVTFHVPTAPASTPACYKGHTVIGAQRDQGEQQAGSVEFAASDSAPPAGVHTSVGQDETEASNLQGLLRPSWSAPAYRSDLILRPAAWERLWEVTEVAISAYARARAHGEGTLHVMPCRGGFSAKLRQNTLLELLLETDAALEELREAVSHFPVHRLAWRLAQEAGPPRHAEPLDSAHEPTAGVHPMERKHTGTSEQDKLKPGEPVSETKLHHLAFNPIVAHVVLSRPYPISDGVWKHSTQRHDATTSAAVNHERLRGHHQQCASLITDSLLELAGRPIVTYTELVAVASVMAEVWRIPEERLAGLNAGASLCGLGLDFALQLVKRCSLALATGARKRAHSLGAPGHTVGDSLDRHTRVARGRSTADLSTAASRSSSSSDVATPNSPGSQDDQISQQSPDTPPQQSGAPEAIVELPDGAVWCLEGLARRAAHLHITAVDAAMERCKGAVSTGPNEASTWVGFRMAYEGAVQQACSAEAAARGQPCPGDGGHQARAMRPGPFPNPHSDITLAGDLLRTVLLGAPWLVHRKGASCRSDGGFDGPYGQLPAADRGQGDNCVVVGLEHGRALGLLLERCCGQGSCNGSVSDGAGADDSEMIAAAGAEAPLQRMELVSVVLESIMTGRPRKLTATGPAALRSVLAAVSAVSLISQASLPHPASIAASPSASPADGPIFLRVERVPVRSGLIDGSGSSTDAPVQATGNKGAPGLELDGSRTVQRVDECWRQLFSVTLVPRSAAIGKLVRRLLGYGKAQGKSSGFMIRVPSAAFVPACADSNGSGACSWGRTGAPEGGRDGGNDQPNGAAQLAECKQLLNRALDTYRCAWLQCPDLEALQAATLLIAEVHHDLCGGWGGSKAASNGPSGSGSVMPQSLSPGLEVLPFLSHRSHEQLIREARGRIMQDLLTAVGPPPEAAERRAGGSAAHGPEHDPPLQRQTGRGGCTAGMLENGWQAVWRLALNREACCLLGLLEKGFPGRSRGSCDAMDDAEGGFSTSLLGGIPLAPWGNADIASSLLVFRQQDLEHDAGGAWNMR